ncbi:hypothetical protein SADUNF_Sadunf19G0098800 [Salix dunnii]|uniref:RING-CH-type domain-containing protein n=1 Tax=Salix dunnii TaxID=1413687 RepID=A0A835J2Z6_9ROSI|nr:hypothetical protein SADUNF_Sadunf19G0098800 [Salix dunnii]
MVDDLMVCVDRIIVASSCFEPVNNGERNGSNVVRVEGTSKDSNVKESIGSVKGNEEGSSCSLNKVEMVECRICQEEDEVLALEAPCSCNGTLKLKVVFFLFYGEAERLLFCAFGMLVSSALRFCALARLFFFLYAINQPSERGSRSSAMLVAHNLYLCLSRFPIEGWFWLGRFAHRKCIQRWCNKKGDITCEICNQDFSPNYSLPPPRSNPDFMAIDIRQAWGHHIDLHDSHLLALEHQLLQSEYEDYAVANTSSLACLRSVALILLIILLLRQALMVTRESGMMQEMSSFFSVSDGAPNRFSVSGFASSICWFSFAMLCDGPLLVHCTKPKEETCISLIIYSTWVKRDITLLM